MNTIAYLEDDQRPEPNRFSLLLLVAGLAGCAWILQAVAGPPHLPARWPSWTEIVVTLEGSSVPLEALAYIFTSAAWLLWLWLGGSLVLNLIARILEILTDGATWVRGLRSISDAVTLPVVRKIVDGAIVAIIVVNLAARTPRASAAPLDAPATIAVVASPASHGPAVRARTSRAEKAGDETVYTVQRGDTLWTIAQRFYGTGEEFPRLIEANAGRTMPDGRRFERTGVIQPGWQLRIPPASKTTRDVNGKKVYVVEKGDTLRGIAARFLGDESRWPEIFNLDRGVTRMPDGRVLSNADLIWPGLQLVLPISDESTAPAPAAPPTEPDRAEQPTLLPTPAPCPPTAAQPVPISTPLATPIAAPATPSPVITPEPRPASPDASIPIAAFGAAGLAVAGGAVVLARARTRRSLNEPLVLSPADRPNDEFAEASFARALRHQIQDGQLEPITLLTLQTLQLLAENGIDGASVLLVRQERNAATFTLTAGLAAQDRILEIAEDLGRRLGGIGRAEFTPDHDVALRISSLALARLGAPPDDPPRSPLCLLPLGVPPGQEALWTNWPLLGHVLITGLPGGGTEVILTSLLAALTAHRRPDELRLWMLGRGTNLPEQLQRLPHLRPTLTDPGDGTIGTVLEEVRTELLERMRVDGEGVPPSTEKRPELVLVVNELGELPRDDSTLEWIGVHGPAHGIRLIATTTNPAPLGDALTHFSTRLVLQTMDDDESILLLGRPEGSDLGSGDVFVRVDGREPVRARGFRVSSDHLDELLGLMDGAYAARSTAPRNAAMSAQEQTDAPPQEEEQVSGAADGDRPDDDRADGAAEAMPKTDGDAMGPLRRIDGLSLGNGYRLTFDSLVGQSQLEAGEPEVDATVEEPVEHTAEEIPLPGLGDEQRPVGPVAATEPNDASSNAPVGVIHQSANGTPSAAEGVSEHRESDALLEVRCLGEFSVRHQGREITPSLAERTSSMAWELLAFLAAQPDGAAPREKLVAALWPDIDLDHALQRMYTAMSRLRAILARQVPGVTTEVVRCERSGRCSLDTTIVWSDVHRFVALVRAAPKLPPDEAKAALTEARRLYVGDLITGRGAHEYEWLEERDGAARSPRERYRDEFTRATLRLARLNRQGGEPERAVTLYRELLKAEPILEDVVRDLYRCYHDLGDLGALLHEERHLREALREAYANPDDPDHDPDDYPPETETIELFETIRADLEARLANTNGPHRN